MTELARVNRIVADAVEAAARTKRKKKKWKDTRRRLVTGDRLHVSIWRVRVIRVRWHIDLIEPREARAHVAWKVIERIMDAIEKSDLMRVRGVIKTRWLNEID